MANSVSKIRIDLKKKYLQITLHDFLVCQNCRKRPSCAKLRASCRQINMAKSESEIRLEMKRTKLNVELPDLVCQNCQKVPNQIYTCASGKHTSCNDCFQTFPNVCKCKSNIKKRNKGLEKMLITLPLSFRQVNMAKSETQFTTVCQKCKQVPKDGPIYTCNSRKHAICNDCFQASKVCQCKANINNRNKVLEEKRATLPLSCKNRINGCTMVLRLESLLDHEVICQWRPVSCPDLNCPRKKYFKFLGNHLTKAHPYLDHELNDSYIEENCHIEEDDLKSTEYKCWLPSKICHNGDQFFREIILKNNRFYLWVYYYGSKKDAKNFNCTIKVTGGNNEEFSYKSHPRTLDETKEEIINGDNVLSMSLSQAKRIVCNDGMMNFSVRISKATPASKFRLWF